MIPHKVSFYAYAENETEVKTLQDALNNFVREQYNKGIIVSAPKLLQALRTFSNNYFVTNYLRK